LAAAPNLRLFLKDDVAAAQDHARIEHCALRFLLFSHRSAYIFIAPPIARKYAAGAGWDDCTTRRNGKGGWRQRFWTLS
jgi:hypothetical protein